MANSKLLYKKLTIQVKNDHQLEFIYRLTQVNSKHEIHRDYLPQN